MCMCQAKPCSARQDFACNNKPNGSDKVAPGHNGDTKVRNPTPPDCMDVVCFSLFVFTFVSLVSGYWVVEAFRQLFASTTKVDAARPDLFIRLAGVEGLDLRTSLPEPPAFHLTVGMDGVSRHYRACSGGGNSMLRVSYHGIILAWGHVPRFCIDGASNGDGVATTVVAKAEGAVLREEMRRLVSCEQGSLGKAEFDVEGEVAELGYLRCKAFYFDGDSDNSKAACFVQ